MTDKKTPDSDATAFWRAAQRRLSLADPEPPISLERANRLGKWLPARHPEEPLADWLRRVRTAAQPAGQVLPFSAKPRWRFTPLASIRRLAADSGGTDIPLPDPGRALETEDGRFRLTITAQEGRIQLLIEALGLACEAFANRHLGIAGPRGEEELVAIIALDDDGEGCQYVDDRPEVRQALVQPVIGLIEEACRGR